MIFLWGRYEEEIQRKDDQMFQKEKEWQKQSELLEPQDKSALERENSRTKEEEPHFAYQKPEEIFITGDTQNSFGSHRAINSGLPPVSSTKNKPETHRETMIRVRNPLEPIENRLEEPPCTRPCLDIQKYREADFEELNKKVKELKSKVERLTDENHNLKLKIHYFRSNGRIGRENPREMSLFDTASKRLNYNSLNEGSNSPKNKSTAHWKSQQTESKEGELFTLRGNQESLWARNKSSVKDTFEGLFTMDPRPGRNFYDIVGEESTNIENDGRKCETELNKIDPKGEERDPRSRSRSASRLVKLLQSIDSGDEPGGVLERSLSREFAGSLTSKNNKKSLFDFSVPLNSSSQSGTMGASTKGKIASLKNNKVLLEKKLQDFERRLKNIEE
jgi:hypothetical protein